MQTWKPNLITRIATTLMVLPMAFNSPAKANTMDDHVRLLGAVQSTGVTVKINPDECDEENNAYGWFGTYQSGQQELVVCQVNKITGVSEMVRWSAEDLDTIRHEAHHLVQDCMDRVRDGSLTAVYTDPVGLGNTVIGEGKVREANGPPMKCITPHNPWRTAANLTSEAEICLSGVSSLSSLI
jgi:hypothetical protein